MEQPHYSPGGASEWTSTKKHDNETGDDFIVAQIGHGELGIDFDQRVRVFE